MALVPYCELEALPDEHRRYAEELQRRSGRLPWLRLMGGHFPPFLDAVDAMYPRFMTEGKLDRKIKEIMFVASSEVRACEYCVGTHSRQLVQELGMTREQVVQARAGAEADGLSEQHRSLKDFARKAAGDPKKVTAADIEALRGIGFDDDQIVEAVAVVAFSAFTNAFADTLNLADDFASMGIEDEVF